MRFISCRKMCAALCFSGWLTFTITVAPAQSADPIVAVVGPANHEAASVTKSDLRKILLGERLTWSNGKQILVIMRPNGSPDRAEVLRVVCGMSESIFTRNQLQASFTGGVPATIKTLASAGDIRSLLKSDPNAIGFLHKHELDASVQAVATLD